MSSEKFLLLQVLAEGGGESIYRWPDGSVSAEGGSGGFLDEEEDPVVSWKQVYPDFRAWWKTFTENHGDFWIYFYPENIHADILDFLREQAEAYPLPEDEDDRHRIIEAKALWSGRGDVW